MSKQVPGQPRKTGGSKKPVPPPRTNRPMSGAPPAGKKPTDIDNRKKRKINAPTPGSTAKKRQPNAPTPETTAKKQQLKATLSDMAAKKQQELDKNTFDTNAEEILIKKNRPAASHQYLKALPTPKAPSSPKKRKAMRVLFYTLTILILVSVCVVLSLTVFFKIDSIEVNGETRYDKDDLVAACMIQPGDNLILCNTSPGEQKIWEKFPYIENVKISKKLFNQIIIEVKEATPTSIIESEGRYVLLSESGKVIDISDKRQTNAPIVLGAKLKELKLSSTVKYQDENIEGYIKDMLDYCEKYKIGTIETIDITNLTRISLVRKEGLTIILGNPDHIEYKLKTAGKIIQKSVPENDAGTLDVSLAAADGGKSYFNSKKPEPSKPEASKTETSKQETSKSDQKTGESSKQTSETSAQTSTESSEPVSEETSVPEETSEEEPVYDDGGYTYDDGDNPYDDGGYTYDEGDNTYDDGGNDWGEE